MKRLPCSQDRVGLRMRRLAILCLSTAFLPGFAFADDCTPVISNLTNLLRQAQDAQFPQALKFSTALMISNRADYTDLGGKYHSPQITYSIIYLKTYLHFTSPTSEAYGLNTRFVTDSLCPANWPPLQPCPAGWQYVFSPNFIPTPAGQSD